MKENGDFGKWTAGHLLPFLASLLPERKEIQLAANLRRPSLLTIHHYRMTLTEENFPNPIQDEGDVAISHFPHDTGNEKQRKKTTENKGGRQYGVITTTWKTNSVPEVAKTGRPSKQKLLNSSVLSRFNPPLHLTMVWWDYFSLLQLFLRFFLLAAKRST